MFIDSSFKFVAFFAYYVSAPCFGFHSAHLMTISNLTLSLHVTLLIKLWYIVSVVLLFSLLTLSLL